MALATMFYHLVQHLKIKLADSWPPDVGMTPGVHPKL